MKNLLKVGLFIVFSLVVIGYLVLFSQRITRLQNLNQSIKVSKESPHTIVAVGDVACPPGSAKTATLCHQTEVFDQIKKLNPEAVLLLGDLQYDKGDLSSFQKVFDPLLGSLKDHSLPTPGNHEYVTPNASGYMTFWQSHPLFGQISQTYYSHKIGDWQVLSLNTNCEFIGGCGDDSKEATWLKKELASSKTQCSLAFWHQPVFTSGKYFDNTPEKSRGQTFWKILQDNSTDIVLNGHDHLYERFAKQRLDQTKDEVHGIRQFTVGTGGKILYPKKGTEKNQEVAIDTNFGFLRLDLYQHYYKWFFVDENNKVLDSGTTACSF